MATKNYRYLKDGSKNPNYKPTSYSAKKATSSATSKKKTYKYDSKGRKITNSVAPAVDRNPTEEKEKKQLPLLATWGNAVKDFLSGGKKGEKDAGRNLSPTANGRKIGEAFDAQFTDEYFESNPEYQRWIDTDINTGAARDVGNMVDVLRRRQAGFNYRSHTESPDSRYKKGDELYAINNDFNKGITDNWLASFLDKASEDDLRWAIDDWEKKIAEAPVGSEYRTRTQADLDAVKDYAKKNFSSFANDEINRLGGEMAKLNIAKKHASVSYDSDLLAEVNAALEAGRTGYNLYDYVGNRSDLREAVGFDELEAQYEDPDDFTDALRTKLETIADAETAMQNKTNTDVLGYQQQLEALDKEMQAAQGVRDDLLTAEKYQEMLGASWVPGAADRYNPEDYQWYSQDGERTQYNLPTLMQIMEDPEGAKQQYEQARAAGAGSGMAETFGLVGMMTEEERQLYKALAVTEGEESAQAYFEHLQPELYERETAAHVEEREAFATQNPILASAASVPEKFLGTLGMTADMIAGREGQNQFTDISQAERATVEQQISEATPWAVVNGTNLVGAAYQGAMSYIDSLFGRAVTGVMGGGNVTGDVLLGLGSATEAYSSAYEATDGDVGNAIIVGIASGALEAGTEHISWGKLSDTGDLDSATNVLKYIAAAGATEGGEEVISGLGSKAIEGLVLGSDSEIAQKYKDYTSNGYTSVQAVGRIAKELGWETTLEFFIGSLMGGTAASVNAGVQVGQQAAVDRSIGRQIQEGGNAAAVIRAALESADANIRALGERLVSKIQETGLPQDAETAAEIQVAAEAVGMDANGQKVAAPALEIKQPEAEAVAAQQPAEEVAPVVEEEPAEPVAEEFGTSGGAEEKPELEWREQPAEEAAPAEETAPEKVSPEHAKKAVTEIFKGSTRKLGKLYRKMMGALDVEINTKSVEEIKTAVQNRLKQLGEDVIDPVATAIAKLASGEQMTSDELDLLEASTVRQGVLNEVATSLIRNGGREYLSDDTVNLMERRGALQQATTAKDIKVAQKQTAAAPARVQEMVEETIAADEDGSIQARAQMLGNDEAAKTMISMAKDVTNTHAYATAFEAAYDYGTAGIDPKVASTSKETTALTPEQFQAAYQAGVKAAAAPVRAAKTGGKVTFAGNLGSRLNEMDGNQRAGIRALQQVARVGTVNVEFFESTADESGKYSEDNGWYDPNTNTIHIDINAGRNTKTSTANFALLKVASHELTHYIKAQNASGYKGLQDFVVSQLTTNGTNTFDGLVALKMKQRKDISYEVAVEEVVADGCEMMLKDSTAIQRLAQENKGLFRRIRNWLRSFIANVKRAFRGVQATSAEARLIKDLEGLQKVWDDALVQASRNVQQSAAEALHMSAETQQAIENDQDVDAEAEVKHSIRLDERFGTEAQRINQANGFISAATLKQALADRKVIRDIFLDPANRDLLKLPPDIEGDTFVSDASYGGTEENTTVCIRSMAAQALMDLISQNLGRPLTVQDTLLISQEIAGLTDRPECYYCYVATDRRAYRDFLGQYLAQRDEVVKKYQNGADKDELYTEFLGGRKSTANMRARFDMWINAVDNGIPMIDGNDLASLENLFGEVDSLRGEILAAAAEVSGIEAGKLNIVNGSVRYAKSGKQITATTLNALKKSNPGMADTINRYMQLTDATAYAQSASWAKKMKGYAAYNGHILNWSQKRVNDLNKHYGLRMYSFSDFSPAFILENMQMVTDAAVRGLNMLGYTKEMPFAEIFAPSGMNINISTFAYEQGGEVKEDYKQGASWERAKALREKHPNVGIVMVATSDNILEWALQQDWVDVVIPYHLVRTGTDVAEYFGYKNYTGVSADGKGLSFAEKNKGKGKKERVTSVSPVEHRNDLISYVDALERYGLTPRFAQWLNGLDDYRAGKISPKQFRDMNLNYMKLVNETRRSYADTDPVQPKFDMGAAKEAINQMIREGGYYTPVGGSVEAEFEIAGAVADKIRDSGVRYSIRESADGYKYVDVDTDQAQFDGLTDNEKRKLAEKIIRDKFMGKVIGKTNRVFVNGVGADEYARPAKHLKDSTIIDAKMRAAPELDNLMDAGFNFRKVKDGEDGHVHANAVDGFTHFDTIFHVGGGYYIGRVNVINGKRGRLFKDVTNIKSISPDHAGSSGQIALADIVRNASEEIITPADGDVKKSIRTDSLTDREILADAFETVASNDTERRFLKNYRDKIADLQQKQEQLRAINKDITDRKAKAERKPNGRLVYDEELIKQQNRAKILRAQIDREDNAIIEMIKSKPLQDVLRRQKKRIESIEAGKRREAIATIRDRRNATEVRHKIKAVLDDFNRRLKNPTEKSYIPANMVQLVIAAEELIDTRSGREGEKAQAKLAALQGMYERYKSDATFAYVYDPVIADMLNSLSSVVGNKSIYQLNSAELQSVYETLKALKKQVTEAVQLKAGDYARSIIEAGREMIRETQAAAPLAKGKAGEFLNWQLTPDKFFARLAGFKKNSIWSKVAESFSKGTEKMLEIQRDHYYHFKKFTESKEFDKLNDQKHLVDIGLTNDKGETVKVTRGMMLSAYMHLSNEENARGFMYGGFSIPNLKAYYDGKVKESYGRGSANTRGTAQELYELAQQMNDPNLTEEQLAALEAKHDQLIMEGMNRLEQMRNDIYSQMTQYEKDLVAAVRAWNDGKSQAYINDVTMDLYGIKKASVQNYFPIHRDTAFVNTDFTSISRNVNLENWGSLKTRVPSQAPILLTDIAFEMDSSLNQMSRYVGYARAQRDFGKLYNVRMPGMSGSVKKAVSVKFGTGAGKLGVSGEQYIENYIGSITGSRQGQSGPLSLIRRNLVRSTMTLNLRVGFSQLSAIPKAAAEVGWDSMISGFANGGFKAIFSKSAREDLAKQNAWFWQRYRGEGGQREFADAKGGNDIISKAWNKMDDITRGKLLNWCQNFDVMSTVSMWSMAKAWARKHTNYAEGSAEFIEAANKKYTDILRNTQAMSTTTERSDASRNTSDGWNLFMMFKSEAFANFNLLYDAVAKVRKYSADFKAGANGVTRADVNAAKRHLAGAATSVILGASLGNAILKLAINALMHAMNGYRDDEDEIGFESILTAIGKEVASDTTGMVLLGGELYEFISAAVMGDKYYAPTDMALGEVTELLETVMKVAQDEDRTAEDVLNAGKKVAFNLTNIFGVPAENGKRFVKMIQDWRDEFNNETPWYEFEGGVTRSNSTNYDRLYNAAIAGDDAKFEQVLVELAENGVEEKDARGKFVTERVKDAYKDGEISADEARKLMTTYGGKDNDEAFWAMEEWNYTGEGKYSKYAELRTALKESNASVAKTEIQKLTSHGTKEQTVIDELGTMYNNGEATTIMNLQLRSNNLYSSDLKLKTDKQTHKDDFDAFITAIVSGGNISGEISKLKQKGYTTSQCMSAINGAFGGAEGSKTKRYRRMEYYNPKEAKVLLDRILNAYAAIGLDRNEEIAWINENWEKFVPETED